MVSILSAALRLGVFIGTTYGLIGSVSAQMPGPGQVGGMGQGGAPTGEFPSERGNASYGQRYTPAEDFPPERMPGNKDMNEDKNKSASSDSSAETSPQPGKRREEGKADTSIESGAPEAPSAGVADTDMQRK